jgi:hypothetical protein
MMTDQLQQRAGERMPDQPAPALHDQFAELDVHNSVASPKSANGTDRRCWSSVRLPLFEVDRQCYGGVGPSRNNPNRTFALG